MGKPELHSVNEARIAASLATKNASAGQRDSGTAAAAASAAADHFSEAALTGALQRNIQRRPSLFGFGSKAARKDNKANLTTPPLPSPSAHSAGVGGAGGAATQQNLQQLQRQVLTYEEAEAVLLEGLAKKGEVPTIDAT